MSVLKLDCEDSSDLAKLLEKMVKLSSDNDNKTVIAYLNGVKLYADSHTTFNVISSYYEDNCKQIREVEKIKIVIEKLHNLMSDVQPVVGDSK